MQWGLTKGCPKIVFRVMLQIMQLRSSPTTSYRDFLLIVICATPWSPTGCRQVFGITMGSIFPFIQAITGGSGTAVPNVIRLRAISVCLVVLIATSTTMPTSWRGITGAFRAMFMKVTLVMPVILGEKKNDVVVL